MPSWVSRLVRLAEPPRSGHSPALGRGAWTGRQFAWWAFFTGLVYGAPMAALDRGGFGVAGWLEHTGTFWLVCAVFAAGRFVVRRVRGKREP